MDDTMLNNSINEQMVMEAINKQFEKNKKISMEFNKYVYAEMKDDLVELSSNLENEVSYDGRSR